MRGVIAVAALLALAGCKSTAERAAEDDGYCQSISARPGTDAYVQCRLAQQQRRDIRRQQLANDIGAIGANIQRNTAAANRSTTCNSTRIGDTVRTTCE